MKLFLRKKDLLADLNRDKIDELRKLQCNIMSLSPKTVSSVSTVSELPEIDFNDEEGYEKIMKEREEHEKKRQAKKRKAEEEKAKLNNK
jgi:hypothetical protein